MLIVSTLLAMLAVAPSEPGAETTGVPAHATVPATGAAGVMVTVMVPAAFGSAASSNSR